MKYRFVVLNIAWFAAFGAAWRQGWIDLVLDGDQTRLSVVIFAVFLVGVIAIGAHRRHLARYIEHKLVMLGLIGTVIGFIIALRGIDPGASGDLDAVAGMVTQLIRGLGVAMFTTLVGSIGSVWLGALLYFTEPRRR